jgi:hypothetical protein
MGSPVLSPQEVWPLTLISEFWPPELWENKFLWFEAIGFVTVLQQPHGPCAAVITLASVPIGNTLRHMANLGKWHFQCFCIPKFFSWISKWLLQFLPEVQPAWGDRCSLTPCLRLSSPSTHIFGHISPQHRSKMLCFTQEICLIPKFLNSPSKVREVGLLFHRWLPSELSASIA